MTETRSLQPDEERGLAALLDALIPPDPETGLPGAGELGLAPVLAEQAPELRPLIAEGLDALDARAAERGAASFHALPPEQRGELVEAFASGGAPLVPALVFHTYSRYYQDRRVVEALGLEHRPPYPKGFEMEPTDPALFENVRRRGPLYRSP